jgi:2-methylcitrate dehydratase
MASLPRDTNQAIAIGQVAIDFMQGPGPDAAVLERTRLFHTDAVLCGASALALRTNAPTILRAEALEYPGPSGLLGGGATVKAEKAVVANSSAMREWDSNGTNFGYDPARGRTAGEFGHNDFYPVAVAAAQQRGLDGATTLRGMVLVDEIRGRLAEVFSLKSYKIDHVLHGAIASAATYGAMMGATAEQIESAIGMTVAHYTPWRAIRAGKQLSDSKGASAALSAEVAVLSMERAMRGFLGPKDIFRNPESVFRQFEPQGFDLDISTEGDDFAVMGMHFKLGLYEHQSASALQAAIDLIATHPEMLQPGAIAKVEVAAYEPAFGIIGDPAKRDPRTRQSADHSMVYIVATLLRKAMESEPLSPLGERGRGEGREPLNSTHAIERSDSLWQSLMLLPEDYGQEAILNPTTRALMEKISFVHGGLDYDAKYPEGIPTSLRVTLTNGAVLDSGLVMFPAGHARNTTADLRTILGTKFQNLGSLAFGDGAEATVARLERLGELDAAGVAGLYDFEIQSRPGYE